MKLLPRLFLILFLLQALSAHTQVTLVREEPGDTLSLSCAACTTEVVDLAIYKGQQWVPYVIGKGAQRNLLYWRYFDAWLGRESTYPTEMLTEKSTLLLDDLQPTDTVSLHINLLWTDSTGRSHAIYLILAGLEKQVLTELPLQGAYDQDAHAAYRFAAVARIRKQTADAVEIYDSIDGYIEISAFNPRKSTISGKYEFLGNCMGVHKVRLFSNGIFAR